MKTTLYDEGDLTGLFLRYGAPAFAWALVLAFFAFSGLVSHEEPRQLAVAAPALANVAPAPGPMATETDEGPAAVVGAPSTRDPSLRDPAVVAHEALDPVGAGLNTTR